MKCASKTPAGPEAALVECSSTTEPQPATRTPHGRGARREDSDGKHGGAQDNLLEQILSRENPDARSGETGEDQQRSRRHGRMSVQTFPEFARQHWERIRSALERGTYRPAAVLRVMIPKATGGQRPLGIPTVLDRVIQQAIAQVIGPLYEPHFSEHSYGLWKYARASCSADYRSSGWSPVRFAILASMRGPISSRS